MATPTLVEQREEYSALAIQARSLSDSIKATIETGGDPSPEDVTQLSAHTERLAQLEPAVRQLAELEIMRTKAVGADEWANSPVGRVPFPMPKAAAGDDIPRAFRDAFTSKSAGDLFLENEGYQAWKASVGHIPEGTRMRIDSPPVAIPGGFRALVTGTGSTSGGALIVPDQRPGIEALGQYRLTLRDLITVGQTNTDHIEYVRMTGRTNSAAAVAEATAATGTTGTKPQSDLALERVSAVVKTIAHWIAATNRALDDASQIRTLIDAELRQGLEQVLENQILNGNNSGENFEGVLTVSGVNTQSWDTDLLRTMRLAKLQVETDPNSLIVPTAYVMHPEDIAELELTKDDEGRYYFGGPGTSGALRTWSLPVVPAFYMAQGTGAVAYWPTVVLWDRMQAAISVSNSHEDFFTRNLVAILAELRAALGVLRPERICTFETAA